jgi:hypothetical protein
VAGQHHDGQAAHRGEQATMNLQRHHIIVAVIAIVVAFALAANYYLW